MPTENRSSNTEMVSVPREKLRQFIEYSASVCKSPAWVKDKAALLAALEQPAPQPHPDPIAWMVGTAIWWTKEEAERDAAATGLPIVGLGPMSGITPAEQRPGEPVAWMYTRPEVEWPAFYDKRKDATGWKETPLYTHADPGQAEDLLASTSLEFGDRLDAVEKERDTLRAQLAELSGLLKQADEFMYIMTGHDSHARLAHKYGEKWWDAIDKLRGKVCTAISSAAAQVES